MLLYSAAVFHLTFVRHELRRRLGRTILTALGLALGIGLVIGIIGVSQGLDDAQDEVLDPLLKSVGTDILVTRVAGQTTTGTEEESDTTTTTLPGPQFALGGPGGGPAGGGFFAARGGALNQQDVQELLEENRSVVTDLATLGEPGEQFTRDFFLSGALLSFPEEAVEEIAAIDGVSSAVAGLVLQASHQTGTVPEIVASIQTGGETFTQTTRPEPMTDAERAAFQQCLADKGVTIGQAPAPGAGGGPGAGEVPGPVVGGTTGGGGVRVTGPNPAFDECLPARFREFRATFTTPVQTLRQLVDPPSTDITNETYFAGGLDPAHPESGLVTAEQLTAGRWLEERAKDEVLVSVAYANTKSLELDDTIPINGTDYKVVGLVRPTLNGSTADVYFSLATLQEVAGKDGRITQVLVRADSAESLDAVAAKIQATLPGAEIVTTKALADQVTGSLADAQSLVSRLGGALAAIVLAGAFAIAALLTLSSIAKRVREIGTLRAIGWSKGRVVRQVLGETVGIGVLGGLLGLGVGALVAVGVEQLSPTLTAKTPALPGIASSNLSALFGQAQATASEVELQLTAPLHASTLLIGIGFALLGGLLAGLVGGWRAARLSPAVALRDLG